MAHPNVEKIRGGFDAFARGDLKTARSLFHPEALWHVARSGPLSGNLRGFDAIAAWGAQLKEGTGGNFSEVLVDVLANDAWVVQIARYRAERNGRKVEDWTVNTFRMIDGQEAECWVTFGDSRAFDDFWS